MGSHLRFAGLCFSRTHHSVTRDGIPVIVGGRGLDLLACLLERPRQVVTAEALTAAAWNNRYVHPNNLAVQLSALRRALGDTPDGSPLIRTVPGRGYMLSADVEHGDPSVARIRTGLPALGTRFIGRRMELTALRSLLAGSRFITVAGGGGVGKTRLVRQALADQPAAGLVWVDLARAADTPQIVQALAVALGDVHPTPEALAARLRDETLLLVLDNAERVADGLGAVLGTLLAECPGLRALVTSRQVLRGAGETVFRLDPMALPPTSAVSGAELTGYDCVQLFADRASAAEASFTLTDANVVAVAEICWRLDGIALAIEMAVPRLRAMSPAEIAVALRDRFDLLQPAGDYVLSRQRSLHTMLDWSWELLGEAERETLSRLATFRSPVTLRLLAAVGPDDDGGKAVLADLLLSLADKSLVVVDRAVPDTRYRLLQTTRDYVQTKMPFQNSHVLRDRHAAAIATLLEEARSCWSNAPTTLWLGQYLPAIDELRAALTWTTRAAGDGRLAVRLVAASLPLWLELPGPPLGEMHGWFDTVARDVGPGTPDAQVAWFRIGQSWRASQFGDVEHRAITQEAIDAARRAGDAMALGVALMRHGHTLMRTETMEDASEHFREAEIQLRRGAPGKWLCLTLTRRADAVVRLGKLETGLDLYEEGVALAHALEFRLGRIVSISNMAEVLFTLGRREEALDRLHALAARIPAGPRNPAMATLAAHLVLNDQGDDAFAAAAEVGEWALATGMDGPLAWALEAVGLLLARNGRMAAAAAMSGFAVRVLPAVGIRFGSRLDVYRELDRRLAEALDPHERARLCATGAGWTVRDAVQALAVTCRSQADADQAQPGARRQYG